MPRITFGRGSRLAALLAATVLGLALAATASADTPPGRGSNGGPAPTPSPTPPGGDCAVLRVQLNGTQPATQTCLAPLPNGQGAGPAASSSLSQTGCGSYDVQLFQDTNYGGRTLCLYGAGSANLRDYLFQCFPYLNLVCSWNDRLSSFRTGGHYVNFYEHTWLEGEKLRYASYQSRASMPSGWNDRVSSLCIWGTYVSCP